MRNAQANYRSRRRTTYRTSRIRPRADGISQQPGLYRTAFLEPRDFAADKRRTGGNPVRVARIGKAACTTCFFAEPLAPTATRPLSHGRELERGQQAERLVFRWLSCWERLPKFGECPLPNPPPRGRERVAADSGVAGRLKKNARNINSRNFSGSLYRKADGTNAANVFSDDL